MVSAIAVAQNHLALFSKFDYILRYFLKNRDIGNPREIYPTSSIWFVTHFLFVSISIAAKTMIFGFHMVYTLLQGKHKSYRSDIFRNIE